MLYASCPPPASGFLPRKVAIEISSAPFGDFSVTGIVCAPAVNTVGNAATTIASTLNPDILLYLLESRPPETNSLMRRSPRQPHTYQKAKDVFSASETQRGSPGSPLKIAAPL